MRTFFFHNYIIICSKGKNLILISPPHPTQLLIWCWEHRSQGNVCWPKPKKQHLLKRDEWNGIVRKLNKIFCQRQSLCRARDEFGYHIDFPTKSLLVNPAVVDMLTIICTFLFRRHRGEKYKLAKHIFVTPGPWLQWAGRTL